jgi:predicted lipoprotein with Yx(FWY)xxD motif
MLRAAIAIAALTLLGATGSAAAPTGGPTVKTAFNKTLKATILVDARGHTLYLYTSDGRNRSACINDPTYHCSKVWPPLLASGSAVAGRGVKPSLLATFTRDDGTTQVSYAGHPLYGFKGYGSAKPDRKPGDLNGQGFIGVWWVLAPSGKAIRKSP